MQCKKDQVIETKQKETEVTPHLALKKLGRPPNTWKNKICVTQQSSPKAYDLLMSHSNA